MSSCHLSLATPEDLAGERFVSFTSDNSARQIIDRVFQRAGVEPHHVAETQYSAALAEVVAQGVGVGLIDPFTAADFSNRGIAVLRFQPAVAFDVAILYPSQRSLSRAARIFVSLLRAHRTDLLGTGTPRK